MRVILRIFLETFLDLWRYMRASPLCGASKHSATHLEGDIIRLYHVLEKGLAMPDFRGRFGADLVEQLVDSISRWEKRALAQHNIHIAAAEGVLRNYYARHCELSIDVADLLPPQYREKPKSDDFGGIKNVPHCEASWHEGFSNVVRSRVSVRNFDINRVPPRSIIEAAIDLSIRTPSVCNRQTWRVHAFEGDRVQELLKHQNGNRGFGHTIPTVLVVTVDMRYFIGAIERYQPWIDGGMFSMTLLLALHSLGLGAVSLNWSVLNGQDKKMREKAEIPDYERIVMLIGCGYAKPFSDTPNSTRAPAASFVNWHK